MSTTIFTILFVLSAVGIGVGSFFLAKARKDRGLLVDEDGDPLHWPKVHMPILVLINHEVDEWTEAFREAIEIWNKEMEMTLFVWGGQNPNPDLLRPGPGVIPIEKAPMDGSSFHTSLTTTDDGTIVAAPIRVSPMTGRGKALRIATHELGHVLGLAHDDFTESIMYPVAIDETWKITDADIATIKKWYG